MDIIAIGGATTENASDTCVDTDQTCAGYSLEYRTIAHDGGVVNKKSVPLRLGKRVVDHLQTDAERAKYTKLLEYLWHDDDVRVETTPFWGPKTWIGMTVYRAKIAFFLLSFIVLPMCYVLWLVAASGWYVLRRAELARRNKLNTQYQQHSRKRTSSDKKNM